MTYEELLIEADSEGLIVREKPLAGSDGRIKGKRIAIPEKYPYTCEESRRPGRRNGPLPHGCRPDH